MSPVEIPDIKVASIFEGNSTKGSYNINYQLATNLNRGK